MSTKSVEIPLETFNEWLAYHLSRNGFDMEREIRSRTKFGDNGRLIGVYEQDDDAPLTDTGKLNSSRPSYLQKEEM